MVLSSCTHNQDRQTKHFQVLKILSCPLFCLCGGGTLEKQTITSQGFALVGSNKAEQISNIYIISFGETTRQSQKYQCQIKYQCQARTGKQTFKLLVPVLQRHTKCVQPVLLRELRISALAQGNEALLLLISSQDPHASKKREKH